MIAPGKIIYTTLSAIAGLTVSPRIDENTRPLLAYSVQALEPTTAKGAILFRNYSVTISLFADSYSQCQSLTDQVVTAIEAIERTAVAGYTIRRVLATFSGDIFEEEIGFGTDITLNITINEVTP